MADNDEDELWVEGAVDPTEFPSRRANIVLPDLALRQALGKIAGELERGDRRSLVIEVPSWDWVIPVVQAARARFPGAAIIGAFEKNRFARGDDALPTLISNLLTVGVSQNPESLLPPSLVTTCEARVRIEHPTGELLRKVARRCLKGRPGIAFESLQVHGLDFSEICACLPTDGTCKQSLARFARAIESKSMSRRSQNVPSLGEARGYGAAQVWARDLVQDIEDLKSGRIGFDEIDRGCVLHGPSGTGKTLFAQIIAKSAGVPFIATSMADMFQGHGDLGAVLKAQRAVFEQARAAAPSILFIDELDGLPNRATMSARGRDWWQPVVNDVLVQIDSAVSQPAGVIVIGATNTIDAIDAALMRKGRLERAIYVGPPDPHGLVEILRYYLRNNLAGADLMPLALARSGATGADAQEWVRAARRAARRAGRPMLLEDLTNYVLPPERRTAEQLRRAAAHEAGHAVAATLLSAALVSHVSIVRTSGAGGRVTFHPSTEPAAPLKLDLEDRVVCLLAGRAAEEVLLQGPPSTGAGGDGSSDLALATNLVAKWHCSLGMGDSITWLGPLDDTLTLLTMDGTLRNAVDAELQGLYQRATELMKANQNILRAVVSALLAKRTIQGSELRAIMVGTAPRSDCVLDADEPFRGAARQPDQDESPV